MTAARRSLGVAGEERAASWYVEHGYAVIDRNWRCREGELDLVVRRARELVFVEVKTRRTDRFGIPAEAVTRDKQRRIRTVASRYLATTDQRAGSLRFDVVSILGDQLDVIEAAF